MRVKLKSIMAFTLAEVLIVVGIIGIVAEMVVPDVVFNAQKQVYVARLEKIMSVLSSGFKLIMANSSCSDMVCTGIMDPSAANVVDNIQNTNVFRIAKVCHLNETGCYDISAAYLNKTAMPSSLITRPSKIVFMDGSVETLYNTSSNCSNSAGNNKYSQVCILDGIIDVNGISPPNTAGKDMFFYYLSKDGLILPAGLNDDTKYNYWNTIGGANNCLGDGTGNSCFGRIMEKGWQMDY